MSLENQRVRILPPLRSYSRRKTLLDLNLPAGEIREEEGPSSQANDNGGVIGASQEHAQPPEPTPTIDIEAIDDDDDDEVVLSSPRSFAEAKTNSERASGRPLVVDVDSGRTTRLIQNNRSKRQRVNSNRTIINCDVYINLEGGSSSSSTKDTIQSPPPPPPKEPTFSCPICMNPFVEETSTKCGHIFCKACIKSAIAVQTKCPTCRKRVVAKDLVRVFLPATSSM